MGKNNMWPAMTLYGEISNYEKDTHGPFRRCRHGIM